MRVGEWTNLLASGRTDVCENRRSCESACGRMCEQTFVHADGQVSWYGLFGWLTMGGAL